MADNRSEIVFFDLETTVPARPGQSVSILEFGAILVCPMRLIELDRYSTLVCPPNLSVLYTICDRHNGITRDAVSVAPHFSAIADKIFDLLHGRIWVGHNILKFDCALIREAFAEIDRPPPEAKGIIDSLALLAERFGYRAGDMKMDTLASYFGLRKQTHRSLDDVRLNLEVLHKCAAVLLLESSLPDLLAGNSGEGVNCQESFAGNLSESHPPVTFEAGSSSSAFFTPDVVILKLLCTDLKVRFGIDTKYFDQAGRPQLSFVVDAPPSLCTVLNACDNQAQKTFTQSGSLSEWRPVVKSYGNYPTVRLRIPTVLTRDVARYGTEIFQKKVPFGAEEKLEFSNFNPTELESLFTPKISIDAFFSLDPYDYHQNAGIRLVAEKLVIHSK